MFVYLNVNPAKRIVNDCVVRSISLAENRTWDETFDMLSKIAKEESILLDDVTFVDSYLNKKYKRFCYRCNDERVKVKDFCNKRKEGIYLATMRGHITCIIDGIIYDTWDCSNEKTWSIWKVK